MVLDPAWLWRAAATSADVDELLLTTGRRLLSELGASQIVIRRLLKPDGAMETIGAIATATAPVTVRRVTLPPARLTALEEWMRQGVMPPTKKIARELFEDAGLRAGRSTLAAPLARKEARGVLLVDFRARLAPRSTLRHVVEALGVVLANDEARRTLAREREAVTAEKDAALARLHVRDIGIAIVGHETGLRDVLAKVEQVAATNTPVLILGETGSGKEVVARAIHDRSTRARGPILRVNCGAIPSELVDSELFGHERGSFTGASSQRRGWFERADGGTLFLDEIGDLPLAAQVRLLRVLQDGVFERVGGDRTIRVDVRIVAATHRDLERMTDDGTFRSDLWYRIGVFPIRLPPLRERTADIRPLAEYFADRVGRRYGAPLQVREEDIRLLASYPWPGNVRELAAVIERAAVLGDGKRLEIARALGSASPRAARPSLPAPGVVALDEAVRSHIENALRQCSGRIEGPYGAARLLHVNPHTLRSKMRKLSLDWTTFRHAALDS